jgi:hypothetical protein
MISDIINAIQGRVKFCIQVNGNSYFVDGLNNGLTFIDAADGKEYTLRNLEMSTITTFGAGTIPNSKDIEEIKANNYSFFERNSTTIENSNKIFDEFVDQAKDYLNTFTEKSENIVKQLLIQYKTKDLEILKILKSNRAFVLGGKGTISTADNVYIRELYYKLVQEKLMEAIDEIDKNITEIDDEDFTSEANQIKQDLKDNVMKFKLDMKGTEYRNLFNQWPTLLNPSPFANVT